MPSWSIHTWNNAKAAIRSRFTATNAIPIARMPRKTSGSAIGRGPQPGGFDVVATRETHQGARREARRGRQGGRHRAIEKTREAAKGDDLEAIKTAVHELEQASHALSKTLYAKAGTAPTGDGGGPQPGAAAHQRRRRRRHDRRRVRGEEVNGSVGQGGCDGAAPQARRGVVCRRSRGAGGCGPGDLPISGRRR